MGFERPTPEEDITASAREAAASGVEPRADMDQEKNNQLKQAAANEFDFSDVTAELEAVSGPKTSETEIQEKAREQLDAVAKERLECVQKMHQAQQAVIKAVVESGRTPDMGKVSDMWECKMTELNKIEAPDVALPGMESREKHANKVYKANLEMNGRQCIGIFKPVLGEAHFYDENVRPERRHRKDWLASQVDAIFNVNRSPQAVIREFPVYDEVKRQDVMDVGALLEYLDGQVTDMRGDWRAWAGLDDISRIADFHYIIGETDGNDGQYVVQTGNRIKNFDHGEAFLDNPNIRLKSAAMEEAEQRELAPNADVLQAADEFLKSDILQAAAAQAFEAAFGPENGRQRYGLMKNRVERYVENKGVPYKELRRNGSWQIIERKKR